jgi:hypothetical protein
MSMTLLLHVPPPPYLSVSCTEEQTLLQKCCSAVGTSAPCRTSVHISHNWCKPRTFWGNSNSLFRIPLQTLYIFMSVFIRFVLSCDGRSLSKESDQMSKKCKR